jgi:hypothetical protein
MRKTHRRRQDKKEPSAKQKNESSVKLKNTPQEKAPTTHHTTEDGYWVEISSLCVDQESLRLQNQLLDIAKKHLEETPIDHPAKIHAALETVHRLAQRVAMLRM